MPDEHKESVTTSQSKMYWRLWGAAQRSHGWNAPEGRTSRPACFISPAVHSIYSGILDCAELLAERDGQPGRPTADHLRHGCHVVATGRDVSSKRMSNGELDRVFALFRLLADPEDLHNVMAWQNGEAGERRRQVFSILKLAPARYWERIAQDRFKTTDLDRLTLTELRQLALTLRLRQPSIAAPTQSGAPISTT